MIVSLLTKLYLGRAEQIWIQILWQHSLFSSLFISLLCFAIKGESFDCLWPIVSLLFGFNLTFCHYMADIWCFELQFWETNFKVSCQTRQGSLNIYHDSTWLLQVILFIYFFCWGHVSDLLIRHINALSSELSVSLCTPGIIIHPGWSSGLISIVWTPLARA